jgi:hypothetical protein
MKPWGRFAFVLIAYGMALLHTAVPHHHGTGNPGVPMISHGGCVAMGSDGLLKRALSTDLGYGHLETFQKGADAEMESSGVDLPLLMIFSNLSQILAPKEVITVFSISFIEKLRIRLLLLSVSHFRAPPVV